MLGGGLLRLDIPYIQHANGELLAGPPALVLLSVAMICGE